VNFDFSVLDVVVMPKSNAYGSKNVTLRMLVNNNDYSRLKKFAKKVIETGTSEYHTNVANELDSLQSDKKFTNKQDAHDLSLIHKTLAGVLE